MIEHDFRPGTDMVKEISEEPYATERFELEVAAGLSGIVRMYVVLILFYFDIYPELYYV